MTPGGASRSTALWAALATDLAVGDPPHRRHPVALVGAALGRSYAPFRRRSAAVQFLGGTLALAGVAGAAGAGAHVAERALRRLPGGAAALGVALKPTLALRQLLQEGWLVARALDAGDLPVARERVSRMVSRPTAELGPPEIAAATIESVAENLGDSVVAPVLAFAARGLPGAAVYRVVNTADAMFGYRDDREWLGKSAARVDDVLNVAPSRVAAAGLAAAALALEGPARARAAVAAARRDHGVLASPNAGWPIGAMAGALGCRLDKPGHYVVGRDWPAPTARDVRRAAGTAAVAAALIAGTVSVTAC